jgi:hypothetical protein
MRRLLFVIFCAQLFAAQPDDPGAPQQQTGTPAPAQSATPAPAAAAAKQSPPTGDSTPNDSTQNDSTEAGAPAADSNSNISGSIDIGYRYRSDVAGSNDSYRSVVNLGSGVKVFGADLVLIDPNHQLFDRLEVHGTNWWDPYNTIRASMSLKNVYALTVDYRDINYFNFLPSWADITVGQGIYLNQQSFDMQQRAFDSELDLYPGHVVQPFFSVGHYSNNGTGVSDYAVYGNEYALPYGSHYGINDFRGGVRFALPRWHITLEGGGTTYKDEDDLEYSGATFTGNRTTPYLGQTLYITQAEQLFQSSGDSEYVRGIVTGNPTPGLDFAGQFSYSQPTLSTNYTEAAQGNFVTAGGLGFASAIDNLFTAYAQQPHLSGSLAAEERPSKRLRLTESMSFDRLHSAGQFEGAGFGGDQFVDNYLQADFNVLADATKWLLLRAGFRYVSGESEVPAALLESSLYDSGQMRRSVLLAGFRLVPLQKASVTWDFEKSFGVSTYFLTSLADYTKSHVQARYKPFEKLQFAFDNRVLYNSNPAATTANSYGDLSSSASVAFVPNKEFAIVGDYTRSGFSSSYGYINPPFLINSVSNYDERAHTASALLDFGLPGWSGLRFAAGGSLFVSSGTRPTSYYQPLARLSIRINRHVDWKSEWHYYGMSEPYYIYEGFRTHTFASGLRISFE